MRHDNFSKPLLSDSCALTLGEHELWVCKKCIYWISAALISIKKIMKTIFWVTGSQLAGGNRWSGSASRQVQADWLTYGVFFFKIQIITKHMKQSLIVPDHGPVTQIKRKLLSRYPWLLEPSLASRAGCEALCPHFKLTSKFLPKVLAMERTTNDLGSGIQMRATQYIQIKGSRTWLALKEPI